MDHRWMNMDRWIIDGWIWMDGYRWMDMDGGS